MVEATVRIGAKGQIVIPKLLRDEFGMLPGRKIIVKEMSDGILLKQTEDPLAIFASAASAMRKKLKKPINVHALEEQYEERARSSGINL
ncbi:MAG: AbrB/MazE/SpoVT family DNA-binding domain-containing protein [Candidatus Aenigmarchaeota archaeon]|nr:AbrB/MazE/SpoVT family DNA-binding domain-containing protein [Candidatus Aenigmarchaeota archaeon]